MTDGVVLIHKPRGPTSHDVVARVRRAANTRRVGHTGTLDPMAEGLVVCCIGRATRIVSFLMGLPKEYTGEITLGASSETYDAEGTITPVGDPSVVEREAIEEAFRSQRGMIEQVAPPYSAVKVKGRKLYEYARRNQDVPRKVRTVWVERFDLVRYLCPLAMFVARVGSGTYIRAMAHEVGERLVCGAHLSALCRTHVGSFSLDDAVAMENLEEDPEALEGSVLTIAEALGHMPKLVLTPEAEEGVRHGGSFTLDDVLESEGPQPVGEPVVVVSTHGQALSVARTAAPDEPYKPVCVLVSG